MFFSLLFQLSNFSLFPKLDVNMTKLVAGVGVGVGAGLCFD